MSEDSDRKLRILMVEKASKYAQNLHAWVAYLEDTYTGIDWKPIESAAETMTDLAIDLRPENYFSSSTQMHWLIGKINERRKEQDNGR